MKKEDILRLSRPQRRNRKGNLLSKLKNDLPADVRQEIELELSWFAEIAEAQIKPVAPKSRYCGIYRGIRTAICSTHKKALIAQEELRNDIDMDTLGQYYFDGESI